MWGGDKNGVYWVDEDESCCGGRRGGRLKIEIEYGAWGLLACIDTVA